jgi:hypothetical protein
MIAGGITNVSMQALRAEAAASECARMEGLEPRSYCAGIAWEAPIVITEGGTYTGNWRSRDPEVAAVTIETDEPVIIRNSTIRSRSDLIATHVVGADVTIRNTAGYGENPNVRGQAPGRFLKAEHFSSVFVKNSYLKGTSGIYVYDYRGNPDDGDTVTIINNRAINVDGRKSNGEGGFFSFNERKRISDGKTEEGYDRVQFVQLNQVQNVPDIDIAWNRVTNEPGRSRVEDNISIYRSSGTKQSPIRIYDNYIHGAYTIKPDQSDYTKNNWKYDWGYAGGGIMLGDGEGSAYVRAYRNQVVATSNYGIAIYSGHDMVFFDNRVVSSGRLPNDKQITSQNVGVYIWDGEDAGSKKFYNNSARDNLVGWIHHDHDRNDWWIPDADSFTGNEEWVGTITTKSENDESAVWNAKVGDAGVVVGLVL